MRVVKSSANLFYGGKVEESWKRAENQIAGRVMYCKDMYPNLPIVETCMNEFAYGRHW